MYLQAMILIRSLFVACFLPSGMPAPHHSAGLLKQAASNACAAAGLRLPSLVTAVSSQQRSLLPAPPAAATRAAPPALRSFCASSYSVEQLLQRAGSSRPWVNMAAATPENVSTVESTSTSGIDRISMNVHDCQDLLGLFKAYIPPLAGR